MKVRIHYRDKPSGGWTTCIVDTDQVPDHGEYVAPARAKVFRVVLTLHVLFDADYDAEVFAERVDFEQVQSDSLGAIVWGN